MVNLVHSVVLCRYANFSCFFVSLLACLFVIPPPPPHPVTKLVVLGGGERGCTLE